MSSREHSLGNLGRCHGIGGQLRRGDRSDTEIGAQNGEVVDLVAADRVIGNVQAEDGLG